MNDQRLARHRRYLRSMHGGFEYGRNDCALFVARYLTSVWRTRDFAKPFRGQYASEEEAFALIRDIGGLLGLCEAHLGRRKPVSQACRGDIAYRAFSDGTESVGVVDGRKVVSPSNTVRDGLVGIDVGKWDCVFEVRRG